MIEYVYDKTKYKLFYHGGPLPLPNPDVNHSKPYIDFGCGFYMGPNYGPAKNWALRRGEGFVNYYLIPIEIYNKFNVHRFNSGSESWLDFVMANRKGKFLDEYKEYDIISGETADNKIWAQVEAYILLMQDHNIKPEEKLRKKKKILEMVRKTDLPYQVCVRNNKCLSTFKCVMIVEVKRGGVERLIWNS